jgi:hypothetical protein
MSSAQPVAYRVSSLPEDRVELAEDGFEYRVTGE